MAAGAEPLVVWVNGAFGVGKTAVVDELVPMLPGAIAFDPELLGSLLRFVIPLDEQTDDYQDIPAWRQLTRDTLVSLARTRVGAAVVVPMTLVDLDYFEEIMGGVRAAGVRVVHVALVAEPQVVAARLRGRSSDEEWGLERVERCCTALTNDRFARHVDATSARPPELAALVNAIVRETLSKAPG